jgi:hypothetical protein
LSADVKLCVGDVIRLLFSVAKINYKAVAKECHKYGFKGNGNKFAARDTIQQLSSRQALKMWLLHFLRSTEI